MDVFTTAGLLSGLAPDRRDFAEFFRSPSGSLSMTVSRRPVGVPDDQPPHTEDEVYQVLGGRARLVVGRESSPMTAGSIAFVPAGTEHRFVEVTEDLELLIFWSPARHSRG